MTRFDARDIFWLFRLPDLGAIKCFEWFQIKLWPPIAPHYPYFLYVFYDNESISIEWPIILIVNCEL
ncbi:MAG: hypothetical protein DRR08_10275 [Candidatus Parabeggiatoa sp. nov. 2]|nr:MAG: hypothetical protein B6247_06220 [Beggiatoa sp. 4572_84]RKZ60831.1 MAG: hypothetical protein DRR08_10275 [Gammaproteobacteria bacterium]